MALRFVKLRSFAAGNSSPHHQDLRQAHCDHEAIYSEQDSTLNHAFSAMTLIRLLPRRDVAQKRYALFHVVMQTPVSYDFTTKKKWEAAHLTLYGTCKWVKDPHISKRKKYFCNS